MAKASPAPPAKEKARRRIPKPGVAVKSAATVIDEPPPVVPQTGVPEWAVRLGAMVDMRVATDPAFALNTADFLNVRWKVDLARGCIHRDNGRRMMEVDDKGIMIESLDPSGQVIPARGARYPWGATIRETVSTRPAVSVH